MHIAQLLSRKTQAGPMSHAFLSLVLHRQAGAYPMLQVCAIFVAPSRLLLVLIVILVYSTSSSSCTTLYMLVAWHYLHQRCYIRLHRITT